MNKSDDATGASCPPAREQHSTQFTGIYSDTTSFEDIIDETCQMDSTELVHENVFKASQHLQTLHILVVDILKNDLYHEIQERVRKKNRKWFREQGAMELLEICAKLYSSLAFQKAICELMTMFFTMELD